LDFLQQLQQKFVDLRIQFLERSIIDQCVIGHQFDLHQILRSIVALGFAVFQFHEVGERARIAFALSFEDPLKADFCRRFDPDQFEMLGGAECVDLRGIPNRVDDVMFVVFDLRQNTFGENIGAVSLAQFITDRDQ